MQIASLDTVEDVRALTGLMTEYLVFVCDDLKRATGIAYDPQVLVAKSLASLDKVVPPHGRAFAALDGNGAPVGMVFVRPSGPEAMEIKRLYVVPAARGTGTGRALIAATETEARARGRTALRIDTTRNLSGAIALYRSLGFEDRPPYPESDHFDDTVLAPALVFMEKRL